MGDEASSIDSSLDTEASKSVDPVRASLQSSSRESAEQDGPFPRNDSVRIARELRQRVKELNCLFGISDIVENSGGSLETILTETAHLLPSAWEHSELAAARIMVEGQEFSTQGFHKTEWTLSSEITVHGRAAGHVEVCYRECPPVASSEVFQPEELRLIDAVAERLGHIVERLHAHRFLEEKQADLRQRLTHLARVSTMGELASSIAHELNQPLTAISTYAQACRRLIRSESLNPTELLGVLDRMSDEALRAGDIVHRLKDLVRKRVSERTRCDVNDLIRGIEPVAAVDARLHDIEFQCDLKSNLPEVEVDRVQVQQVMLNLIRNGFDALEDVSRNPARVTVRTELADDTEIVVSVTDNGCGLPQEADEVLFQSFFTTKPAGLGVGLSISRSIVRAHGGDLWAERNVDGGTTFRFTIPVSRMDG